MRNKINCYNFLRSLQVFGKTVENLRQRVNIELITSRKIAPKDLQSQTLNEQKYLSKI